jgi:hypothetical protein
MPDNQPPTIDVQTWNWALKLLDDAILSYPPTSPESIALYKFKEKLIDNA